MSLPVRIGRCLCAFFIAPPALAALSPAVERQIGGVYSNACGDRSQPMIRLYGDVLDIERGGVAVKASKLTASTQPAPGAPIPDYKATVRGEVKAGEPIVLVLTHNAKGLFARIDASEKVLAPLGPGVAGQQLRHCDPNRNALPGAASPVGPQGPPDLLKDARFRAAYARALGPLAREPWIARLDGPAPELRKVKVVGAEYTLAAACKSHDCAEQNVVLLWHAQKGELFGLVQQRGAKTLLGAPPPAIATQLERLWAAEFRK